MYGIAGREACRPRWEVFLFMFLFFIAHSVLSVAPKHSYWSPSELSVCISLCVLLSASHWHVWRTIAVYCVYGPVHWACMVTVEMSQISWPLKHTLHKHHTAALWDTARSISTNAVPLVCPVWEESLSIHYNTSFQIAVWQWRKMPVLLCSSHKVKFGLWKYDHLTLHSELMQNDTCIVHWPTGL